MYILGISAFYHDSAAVLLKDDEILAAAQEERFTRKKFDASFPAHAIRYCLESAGVSADELSLISFYDKPLLKFERLLETYYAFAPRGRSSFSKSIPVWLREKLLLKNLIYKELEKIDAFDRSRLKLLFPEHHLSHAASAFYPSPFEEAAILTIDGVGEWATASIGHGKWHRIKILRELKFPHSVGLLYSAFTYFLGFRVNSGEYKLMGLAPYGDRNSQRHRKFVEIIKTHLLDIADDGSIWLNQKYFNYATGLTMVKDGRWEALFGVKKRSPEGDILPEHCDLALAIQVVTEEIVLKMAKEAKRLTGASALCLAGGVALNCVANSRLIGERIFDKIWVQPAAGDAGGAAGAAYAACHIFMKKLRNINNGSDRMKGSYLGPEFSDSEIEKMAKKYRANYRRVDNFDDLCEEVSHLLDGGNVVGWFQGRMEYGPRALGNRSILGDARNPEMQKRLNLKIKYRESFRPFAPSVLSEEVLNYFERGDPSPYMLFISDIKKGRRNKFPDNYSDFPLREKLYFIRSDIPAVTHLDYSARLQTVHRETNPRYWKMIKAFQKRTGYGIIVNTSFNVRGEPIVCTPEDAYKCFMRTEMNYLIAGNYFFDKTLQPAWKEKKKWKQDLILD